MICTEFLYRNLCLFHDPYMYKIISITSERDERKFTTGIIIPTSINNRFLTFCVVYFKHELYCTLTFTHFE